MTEFCYLQDHFILYADYKTPEVHSHLASHLLIGEEGGLHCLIGEEQVFGGAVFISSDVPHTIYPESGRMLVFLFDAAASCARAIERKYLQGKAYAVCTEAMTDRLRTLWKEEKDLEKLDRMVLCALDLKQEDGMLMDRRVKEALEILRNKETITGGTVRELCRAVCLSQSRLSHLFKADIGISLNRYLVLEKMRKSFEYFGKSGNITEAALLAGFDSPSHLAGACKRMFGLSFSEFVKSTK